MERIIGLENRKKNLLINGNFDIWQRGNTLQVADGYWADRWPKSDSGPGVLGIQRSIDVPTLSESGFQSLYSMEILCNTANAAMGGGDINWMRYKIEGHNIADIVNKKANLSFWVKTNKIGKYTASFGCGGYDGVLVSEFEITVPDIWQKVSIVVDFTGCTNYGTWLFTNGIGLYLNIVLAGNVLMHEPNLDQWIAGSVNKISPNQVNFMDNTANYMKISQVSLIEGGLENDVFTRAGKNIQEELDFCKRYFQNLNGVNSKNMTIGNAGNNWSRIPLVPEMRAIPTIIWTGIGITSIGSIETTCFDAYKSNARLTMSPVCTADAEL